MKLKERKINLAFIAEECGVTSMTVSMAMRGDERVALDTRRRIIACANKYNYQPNNSRGRPRIFPAAERKSIDVVWGVSLAPVNLFHSQLLVYIEQELSKRQCNCVVRTCSGAYEQFLNLCEALKESRSAAMLIIGNFEIKQLQTLISLSKRSMLVDHTGDARITTPYEFVAFDNVEAARLATRHLVSLGHRRILLITGAHSHSFTRDIESGYREILEAEQVPVVEGLIQATDFSARCAEETVLKLIDSNIPFDAVFTTEEMNRGVLRALDLRHLKVPQDISIVTCEGLSSGATTNPPLTTVGLDYRELGKAAVDHILSERTKDTAPLWRMKLVPRLVIRESTRQAAQSIPSSQ